LTALLKSQKIACIIIFTIENDMLCANNPSGECRNETAKDKRFSKEQKKKRFSSSRHTLIVIGRSSDDSSED
jgi:hypothetical protein